MQKLCCLEHDDEILLACYYFIHLIQCFGEKKSYCFEKMETETVLAPFQEKKPLYC